MYVAQERGYFAEQDLEVEIQHAPTGGSIRFVAAGEVDVTTADAAALLKRVSDQELPVTAFALFGQRGQQAFVALRRAGCARPRTGAARPLGTRSSPPPEYLAVLAEAGLDSGSVNAVRVGFNPRVLTDGEVDVLAVFKSNEPDTIRNALGHEVVVWDPEDYGVPAIGLTYVTRTDLVDEDPELLERFLKATLRGLQYAMENPEEAVRIVLEFAPNEDPEHQMYMLTTEDSGRGERADRRARPGLDDGRPVAGPVRSPGAVRCSAQALRSGGGVHRPDTRCRLRRGRAALALAGRALCGGLEVRGLPQTLPSKASGLTQEVMGCRSAPR